MTKYKQRKGASKRASGGSRWFVSGKTGNRGSKRYKPANYKQPKFKGSGNKTNKVITGSTNIEGRSLEGQSLVASPRTFGNIVEDQYSIGDEPTVTRLEGGGYVERDPLALAQIVANREQELRDRGITD
tara:strand:+ start:750 stop:1136 length:387 start_codon:yes stop_codon:yes gene_type:complete